jgi:hypothetical protein
MKSVHDQHAAGVFGQIGRLAFREQSRPRRRSRSIEREQVDLLQRSARLQHVQTPPCFIAEPDRCPSTAGRPLFHAHSCALPLCMSLPRMALPGGEHRIESVTVTRKRDDLACCILEDDRMASDPFQTFQDVPALRAAQQEIRELPADGVDLLEQLDLVPDHDLGRLLLGHVDHHALLHEGPLGITEERGAVPDPHRPSIRTNHAVVLDVWTPCQESLVLLERPVSILRVQELDPRVRAVCVALGGDPHDALDLRVDVRALVALLRQIDV